MSDFSDYFENAVANVFRGTTLTAPAAVYLALFSTMPSEAGTGGTEVTTTIRTAGRVAIPFGAPSNGVIANTADVDFGTAQGAASVAGVGIYDAATGGNLLALKASGSTQAVSQGANVKFATGAITLAVQ
ncbi:MAG: hypothetical protein ACAH20_16925 [Methylobacteriaceae bacterium]